MPRKKYSNPRIIRTSSEGFCAYERLCYPASWGSAEAKREFINNHRLYIGYTNRIKADPRVFCLVAVRHFKYLKAYFMDAITGSLYDARTMLCMSSDVLTLNYATPNRDAAKKLLKSLRVADVGGGKW